MFSSFFKHDTTFNPNWTSLEEMPQLDTLVDESFHGSVLIFKHSTRCIISRSVLKNFEEQIDFQKFTKSYFLDLLNYRELSNAIATRFQVVHQSPQLLVIQNGVCVFHDSHEGILAYAEDYQ